MLKKRALFIFTSVFLLPFTAFAQPEIESAEYPTDLLATLDSLTVQLNQNCTKDNPEACFDPSGEEENAPKIKFDPVDIQNSLNMMESGIALDYNRHVKGFINLYGVKKRGLTEKVLSLSEYYFPMFEEILDQEGLPQEFKYLAVVESALNPQAQSWAGACGLWQFIHSTGVAYGLKIDGMVDERRDPVKATRAACQYFKNSYELYGDWLLVIASYNCGPGNVNKAIRRSGGKRDFWKIMRYLPRETRGYVPAFIAVAYVMNNAEKLGLKPADVDVHSMVEDVKVEQWVHFGQLEKALGIPQEKLQSLNPEYRKQIIPASANTPHTISLPYAYAMRFAEMKDSVFAVPFSDYSKEIPYEYISKRRIHRVRRGESLSRIARRYGVKTTDIKSWNIIRRNYVRPGKRLVIYTRVKRKITPENSLEKDDDIKLNISEEALAKGEKPAAKPKKKSKKVASKYHRVRRGDSLYSISKKYPGLTIKKLRAYNRLSKKSVIYPGTKLRITPGG
jgi:membrane-bound lytic murein transglycosylase D